MNKSEQRRQVYIEQMILASELLKNELQQTKALQILTQHHNLSTHDIKVFALFCSLYSSGERPKYDHKFQNLKHIYRLIREKANELSKRQDKKFINTSQKNIKESISKLRKEELIIKGTRKEEKKQYPKIFKFDKTRKKIETWQIGEIDYKDLEVHRTFTYNLPINTETLIQAIIHAFIPSDEEIHVKIENDLKEALKMLKSDFSRKNYTIGLLRMTGLDPKRILYLYKTRELENHIIKRKQEEQQEATQKEITVNQYKLRSGIRHLWDEIDQQLNYQE